MDKRKKLWIFIATGVALAAMLLLAAGLSGVELQPGQTFPLGLFTSEAGQPGGLPAGSARLLVQILRIFMLVSIPLAIIYLIISPEARKRALRTFIVMLVLLWVLNYFMRNNSGLPSTQFQVMEGLSPVEAPLGAVPLPEFVPGESNSLITILSFALAFILTLVIIGTAWVLWRRAHPPQEGALVELVREAQDALDDIQAGGDLKNAVIRCYVEMSRVLSEQRGIERGVTMTTREFENRLVREGLPDTSVQQLTRLFEDVRYGTQVPGLAEEQRAVACLSAIVHAVTRTTQ